MEGIEKLPVGTALLAYFIHGLFYGPVGFDRGPNLVSHQLQVVFFPNQSKRPVGCHWPMAGYYLASLNAAQGFYFPEPAEKTAVDDGNVPHEKKIREPEGSCFEVENAEVVVGVSGRVRRQGEGSVAEVQIHRVLHRDVRWNEVVGRQAEADFPLRRVAVVRRSKRHGVRELVMSDEMNAVSFEGAITVNVIGMNVCVNDVANGCRCFFAYSCAKLHALIKAAATVDDGDAARPNNEADVGNFSLVVAVRYLVATLMNEDASSHFLER